MFAKELVQQLRSFDPNRIFSEIAGFDQKAMDVEQTKMMKVCPLGPTEAPSVRVSVRAGRSPSVWRRERAIEGLIGVRA